MNRPTKHLFGTPYIQLMFNTKKNSQKKGNYNQYLLKLWKIKLSTCEKIFIVLGTIGLLLQIHTQKV